MPVLATRFAGSSRPSGPAATSARPTGVHEPVASRLAAEFLTVPADTIGRCVADVCACAEHLGVEATPEVVERVAREHLLALVNSAPPPRGPR